MNDSLSIKIKRAIQQGNLIDKIFLQAGICTGYSNADIFPVQERYRQYLRMKSKYGDNCSVKYEIKQGGFPRTVWICWLQGMEQAPDIVKACYRSVEKYFSKEWKIVVLTKENLLDYVNFPEFVLEKWKKGVITNTHFSDLLRMEILIKYGGLWTDATVLYTDRIPSYMCETNFFTFHHTMRYDNAVVFESWFIYSVANHPLLLETRDMIYKYWKENNKLKEYFLFHIFFTIASEKYPDLWKQVPVFSDVVPHILASELFEKFSEDRYNQIIKMSCVHKLSYKLNNEKINKPETFYNEILKDEKLEDESIKKKSIL